MTPCGESVNLDRFFHGLSPYPHISYKKETFTITSEEKGSSLWALGRSLGHKGGAGDPHGTVYRLSPPSFLCSHLPSAYSYLAVTGPKKGATALCDPNSSFCLDENECLQDPCQGRGRCVNLVGSYSCFCHPGYELAPSAGMQECQGESALLYPRMGTSSVFFCWTRKGYPAPGLWEVQEE